MKLGIVKDSSGSGSIYYRFYCYEFNKEVWDKEKNNVILNDDIKFCSDIEFSDIEVFKEGKGWKVYCDEDSVNIIIIDNEKEEEKCLKEYYDYLDEWYGFNLVD